MSSTIASTNLSPAITAPGIGSGLDVTGLVSKLMAVEQQPLTDLNNQETSYQSQLSAYGSLKSALASFQTAAQALNTASDFGVTKTSVADSSILSASSSTSAVAGTYNVEVDTLAQAQKLASGGFADTTSAISTGSGTGSLSISLGTYSTDSGGATSFTAGKSVTINLDSSNNSLAGIQSAINNANAGVTATIINDGTANRLVLTSQATGTNNAIQVTSSGDASFQKLAYDASTGGISNMTQSQAAQDATLKVDNIAITKHSNTITDAIQGVTLNLTKPTGSGVATQVTVAQDTATVVNNVQNFVAAYNKVQSLVATDTAYNATAQSGSVLTGDSTTRMMMQTLSATLMSSAGTDAGGNAMYLSDIGISFQKDGSIALDSAKLQTALSDPTKNVAAYFSGTTGIATQINTQVNNMVGAGGTVANRTDGLNASIKDLENQKTALNNRLDQIQQNYLNQFNALDSMLAQMQSTGSYLTQQLSSLKSG